MVLSVTRSLSKLFGVRRGRNATLASDPLRRAKERHGINIVAGKAITSTTVIRRIPTAKWIILRIILSLIKGSSPD